MLKIEKHSLSYKQPQAQILSINQKTTKPKTIDSFSKDKIFIQNTQSQLITANNENRKTSVISSKKQLLQKNIVKSQSPRTIQAPNYVKKTNILSPATNVISKNSQILIGSQKILNQDVYKLQKDSKNNFDVYQGQKIDGMYHGKGAYFFYNQSIKYEGQFQNGLINGWGVLFDQSLEKIKKNRFNIIYEGYWRKGKRYGEGKYYYGDQEHFYNGNWVNNVKQGRGIYQSPDEVYNGNWVKNKKDGEGHLKLKNGTQFKGYFSYDYFIKGLIKYQNGDEYNGQFHLGKKEGHGSYYCSQKDELYKGDWHNDLRHGKGEIKFSNGDSFIGIFKFGKIDQSMNCQYNWREGTIFLGWFKNGNPEKGSIKYLNGKEYQF